MTLSEMLKEAEKAFHKMDWEKLVKLTKKIVAEKPEKRTENLANGLYYYALAKLEKDPKKVILNLDKAGNFFKSSDPYLASLADIERLLLLSGFDEKNRGQHLRELGELTQGLFTKTADPMYLHLATDAFNKAKPFFSGKELAKIILGLQFCCGVHAQHVENPEEQYREIVKLHKEIKTKDRATRACSKMNAAIACQNIAFLNKDQKSIKTAIKLNEEAIKVFEQLKLKPETVRAKQSFANVLRDASNIDTANSKKYLKRAIALKKEVTEMFLKDGFDIDSGYEDLEIGITYMEFAACDQTGSDEHFNSAIHHFNSAAVIFEKEKIEEGQGHAKAGIAAVYRHQGAFDDAARMYEEAVAIFKEKDPVILGRTKQNLAATYRDIAKTTGKKGHLKKAKRLEKEAAELLKSIP